MFKWLRRGGKEPEDLASARARVERAQRALLPYASALEEELRLELGAAETLCKEARANEERGEDAAALEGYVRAAETLASLRARVAALRPELLLADLLARAEHLLGELEDGPACEVHLEILGTRVNAHDSAGAERAAARALALVEQHGDPMHAVVLVRQLYFAAGELAGAAWIPALRARAVAHVLGCQGDEVERGSALLALLEAQSEWDDLAGGRATLAELDGEFRQQALLLLVEAEARAGDFERARVTRKEIRVPSIRGQADVILVDALAHRAGPGEALAATHTLLDGEVRANALVKVASARARAGESAAALELAAGLEPRWEQEALLAILEEELERGDLRAAGQTTEKLEADGREHAWGRMSEAHAQRGEHEAALVAARRVGDPFRQAAALEHVAWERFPADREGAHGVFALALELADHEARTGRGGRFPGPVADGWLVLASRIQAALGDLESARMNVARFHDPALRRDGWMGIGWACARSGNVDGLDELVERTSLPQDRIRLLGGAADAALAAVWRARPKS